MNNEINNFVAKLNENDFLNNVQVPILDGFTPIENPNTLFTATNKDNYLEQFLTDGIINEDIDTHINSVIEDTKKSMKEAGIEEVENSINFLKNYKNNFFDFKVYTQDIILNNRIIRQFNIYFIDNDTNAFYQVSLSTGPYELSKKQYVQQELSANMIATINNLMDYIIK